MTKSRDRTTAADLGALGEPTAPRYLLATAKGGVHIHVLPRSGTVILGRGEECQIVLDYPAISREHTRLEIGATCTITDLDSRNGTSLRGQKLVAGRPQRIGVGDSFSVGPVSLLLLAPGIGAPVAAAGAMLRVEDPTGEDMGGILPAIAQATASILILGETGAGKEVMAKRLHELSGRSGPFLAINCAAISESLLESELFGHEKGAFTGATQAKQGLLQSAAGGTLLLDEIGEMSPSVQAKILRAIETQSILRIGGVRPVDIDVRFLGATHRDLLAGAFRRDLYYRLAGFVLTIPPLRERKQQIVKIAGEILAKAAPSPPALSAGASVRLLGHDWPGNVRELRNVIMRALVLCRGGEIGAEHLLFDSPAADVSAPKSDENDERARIVKALEDCVGNQTRAAEMLGISRTTLVQKIKLYGIPRPRAKP